MAEVLEGADGDDPVDLLVELLPALQPNLDVAGGGNLRELGDRVLLLTLAQGQPDDVDVELLQCPLHAAAPAATDIEQGHPGLEVEFAEGQVELGVLRLVGGHVVAFVISAGVAHRGAEEEFEELVGDVVYRLQFLVLRLQRTHVVSNPRFNQAKCALNLEDMRPILTHR